MSDEMETLRIDAGEPYVWSVGEIALRTATTVCESCDDVHIAMSIFLDGELDQGTPLEKTGRITLEPWQVVFDPGGGLAAETERKLEKVVDKYRDEISFRGARMLASRDRELWRGQDLTGMQPGVLVRYRNLFPADFDLLAAVGDDVYFVEDYYCLVPNCPCASVGIEVTKLGEHDGEHRALGQVSFDLAEKPFDMQGADEAVAALRQLMDATDLPQRLIARHVQCRGIAPAVAKKFSPAQRPAPVRRAKVGRNEPCPCGSGKKYKKCCINED